MKKVYQKPEIAFESFVMSTNIAGDCEKPFMTTIAKGTCGIPASTQIPGLPPMTLFDMNASGTNCTAPGIGDEMHNQLCYHNPSEKNNLFNS